MNRFGDLLPVAPMLAFTDGDRWRPGIGDPTVMGWLTVFAYFFTAFLCWRAATKGLVSRKVRWFWTGLAAVLIFLGFNKQLDLQTALTFLGKNFAKSTGWYENRRVAQGIFVTLIGLGGTAFTVWLCWYFRSEWKRLRLALGGVGFLLCFIVIRAASFHHVDQILNFAPGGVRMNWVLELGAIAMIAWPAWRAVQKSSDTSFILVSGGGVRGPVKGTAGSNWKQ